MIIHLWGNNERQDKLSLLEFTFFEMPIYEYLKTLINVTVFCKARENVWKGTDILELTFSNHLGGLLLLG